eukprot:7258660-Prymnesium_polylepis.1
MLWRDDMAAARITRFGSLDLAPWYGEINFVFGPWYGEIQIKSPFTSDEIGRRQFVNKLRVRDSFSPSSPRWQDLRAGQNVCAQLVCLAEITRRHRRP